MPDDHTQPSTGTLAVPSLFRIECDDGTTITVVTPLLYLATQHHIRIYVEWIKRGWTLHDEGMTIELLKGAGFPMTNERTRRARRLVKLQREIKLAPESMMLMQRVTDPKALQVAMLRVAVMASQLYATLAVH